MKRTMLAILAISPLMLHAQAKSSAQPESTPVLHSENIQPAVFATGTPSAAAAVVKPVRVTTGVVAPVLIHTEPVNRDDAFAGFKRNSALSLHLIVDENGKPTNVTVVKSDNAFIERQAVASVTEYRYKPGMLDGSPVPVEVNLEMTITQ